MISKYSPYGLRDQGPWELGLGDRTCLGKMCTGLRDLGESRPYWAPNNIQACMANVDENVFMMASEL